MNKLRQWIVFGIGIGALALAILVGTAPTVGAAPGASDVRVVNTPLPVTATPAAGATFTVEIAPRPMFRKFLATMGGYDSTWTNSSGMVAVITFIDGEVIPPDERIGISISEPPGSYDSHGYSFLGTPDTAKTIFSVATPTTLYVPPGGTLRLGSQAVAVELTGHFEPASAVVIP